MKSKQRVAFKSTSGTPTVVARKRALSTIRNQIHWHHRTRRHKDYSMEQIYQKHSSDWSLSHPPPQIRPNIYVMRSDCLWARSLIVLSHQRKEPNNLLNTVKHVSIKQSEKTTIRRRKLFHCQRKVSFPKAEHGWKLPLKGFSAKFVSSSPRVLCVCVCMHVSQPSSVPFAQKCF